MENTLQAILDEFVLTYPKPGQPAQLDVTVGTHDPNRDNSKFRLSDAGRCRLMRYYKRQGYLKTEPIPPDVLLMMQAGNLLHGWIERAVHEMGCLVSSEDTLEDEHRIGHFDMIIQHPQSQERILYDIKTITSKKAYYMEKNGIRAANPQHIAQLVSYDLMLPDHIDALRMAYVVRDTMKMYEIPIHREEHEEAVMDDWSILIAAWKANEEPEANPEPWECRYCPYASECPSVVIA